MSASGNSYKPNCICDSVYKWQWTTCEKSSGYLCEYRSNENSATFFQNSAPIKFDQAVKCASKILQDARYPLVTGIECLGTRCQQLSWNIAKAIGGVVDSSCNTKRVAKLAMAREGLVTATIGEVSQRSDLLVVVDCNPEKTHPRLIGKLKNGRTTAYIGSRDHLEFANSLDSKIILENGELESVLINLEMLVANRLADELGFIFPTDRQVGLNQDLALLIDKMRAANYVCVLCEESDSAHEFVSTVDSLISVVKRINAVTRCVMLSLRTDRNGLGAENVLTWNSGFPLPTDLSQPAARCYGFEYSTYNLLHRRECDALLALGRMPVDQFAPDIAEFLRTLPTIHFDWKNVDAIAEEQTEFGTDLLEIFNLDLVPDDFVRLDDVMVKLGETTIQNSGRPANDSSCASLRTFLQLLEEQIRIDKTVVT